MQIHIAIVRNWYKPHRYSSAKRKLDGISSEGERESEGVGEREEKVPNKYLERVSGIFLISFLLLLFVIQLLPFRLFGLDLGMRYE